MGTSSCVHEFHALEYGQCVPLYLSVSSSEGSINDLVMLDLSRSGVPGSGIACDLRWGSAHRLLRDFDFSLSFSVCLDLLLGVSLVVDQRPGVSCEIP